MNLSAFEWLRGYPGGGDHKPLFKFLIWILQDSKHGAASRTDEFMIKDIISDVCLLLQNDIEGNELIWFVSAMPITLPRKAEHEWKMWAEIGSNDGWPKEAVINCAIARAAYYACLARTKFQYAADVWLWVASADTLESFANASAEKLKEILA